MTLVRGLDKGMSFDARGKFGFSGGFGKLKFGYNKFGFYSKFAGIYSRKKTNKGWQLSRMVHYRPKNPNTFYQYIQRYYFSSEFRYSTQI